MSENKENKLTLINEKTANDYLTHTLEVRVLTFPPIAFNIVSDKKLYKIDDKGSLQYRLRGS